MKLNRKKKTACGCSLVVIGALLGVLQVVFYTLKLSGRVDWSWWLTLTPTFAVLGLPIAFLVIGVIVLTPKVLNENAKRIKRIKAAAEKYGMERKPGESYGDLNKRIVRRNMIVGDYSRKDIKDEILRAFPNIGSCQILVDDQADEIVLIPRSAEVGAALTDVELWEIVEFAAQYIPSNYKVRVKNADTEEAKTDGSTET